MECLSNILVCKTTFLMSAPTVSSLSKISLKYFIIKVKGTKKLSYARQRLHKRNILRWFLYQSELQFYVKRNILDLVHVVLVIGRFYSSFLHPLLILKYSLKSCLLLASLIFKFCKQIFANVKVSGMSSANFPTWKNSATKDL